MEDILICSCNNIQQSEIVKIIKDKGLKTIEEIISSGTICGQCGEKMQEIIDEMNKLYQWLIHGVVIVMVILQVTVNCS